MEQHIAFCTFEGRRVAYATVGSGPALVLPAWWFSHLEHDWAYRPLREFVSALAAEHTVVRYDRLGTGLSDRLPWDGVPSLDREVAVLEAVVAEAGVPDMALFAMSCAGPLSARFAERHPVRVRRLVFYGTYADGSELANDHVRSLMLGTVREHWGLGSRLLTDVFLPDGDADERRHFERIQRYSASPHVARDVLDFVYACDARASLAAIRAPALVLHRRGDQAVPFELGRRLAAAIRGARLVTLEGRRHVPWLGQSRPVLQATLGFLAEDRAGAAASAAPLAPSRSPLLTDREREVLRLVAGGLADEQIADALIVSPHTVHRHVANIRAKLRQPTRTAAAVEAARRQLI